MKAIGTWDETGVREKWKVVEEYKKKGKKAHFGRVFAILVEKNAELPEDDPKRKYKGIAVFDGSDVRDENREVALFQELSSCPATMQASKAADAWGMLEGHTTQQADAVQAYKQSKHGGVDTGVSLPREAWPEAWVKSGIKDPVCPLILSLYGHPDSGGILGKTLR